MPFTYTFLIRRIMDFARKLIESKILIDTITDGANKQPLSLNNKILFLIDEFGVVSPALLISKLGVVKSNLAIACRELCLKEFITSFKDEHDKRQIHYKLTEKGKDEIQKKIADISSLFRQNETNREVENSIEIIVDFLNRKV